MGLYKCPRCKTIVDETHVCSSARRRIADISEAKVQRFYSGSKWTKLSKDIKVRDGCCMRCLIKYNKFINDRLEVHHIDKLVTAEGWDNRYNRDKLVTLCKECHRHIDNVLNGVLDFEFIVNEDEDYKNLWK